MDQLSDDHIFDVDLVPYGNAYTDPQSKKIQCQHGESECVGNRIHACAAEILHGKEQQESLVGFIVCMEKEWDQKDYGDACVRKIGDMITKEKGLEITACARDLERSEKLVRKNGDRTGRLQPSHNYVPWLTIRNEKGIETHSEGDQMAMMEDLVKFLCEEWSRRSGGSEDGLPKGCRKTVGSGGFLTGGFFGPVERFVMGVVGRLRRHGEVCYA